MTKAFAVCCVVAALLLAGCGTKDAARVEAKPIVRGSSIEFPAGSNAVQRLALERVEEPVARDLTLPGRLVWDDERTARVFPPFSGRITRIRAQAGERVAAGAPLAEIASGDFSQARADLRKARVDLALATRNAERQRELNAQGVASAKDLQQAEADRARAQSESERAQARLRDYGQSEESGAFVLKSPVAGTVVERNLNPGQEVRSDQSGPPLFVISDPTHLWISLDASGPDAASLKAGMRLTLSTVQNPQEAFTGTLKQVSDFVDPVARTVKLRGEVPNPQRQLRAETFVNAKVSLPKGTNPTVNAKAVYLSGNRRYVFLKRGNATFVRSAIEVGPEADGRVPVISGLEVGDMVVVAGNLLLEQILSSAPSEATTAAQR